MPENLFNSKRKDFLFNKFKESRQSALSDGVLREKILSSGQAMCMAKKVAKHLIDGNDPQASWHLLKLLSRNLDRAQAACVIGSLRIENHCAFISA